MIRILVAEDDKNTSRMLCTLLRLNGYAPARAFVLNGVVGMLQKELHCTGPKFCLPFSAAKLIARAMEKKAAKEPAGYSIHQNSLCITQAGSAEAVFVVRVRQ